MKSVLTIIAASSLFAALAMAQTPNYTVTDLAQRATHLASRVQSTITVLSPALRLLLAAHSMPCSVRRNIGGQG